MFQVSSSLRFLLCHSMMERATALGSLSAVLTIGQKKSAGRPSRVIRSASAGRDAAILA
jgi:hypothetical protein